MALQWISRLVSIAANSSHFSDPPAAENPRFSNWLRASAPPAKARIQVKWPDTGKRARVDRLYLPSMRPYSRGEPSSKTSVSALELEHAARELRRERVNRMLDLVRLREVARNYPRQLSGGMKMRVSIARALCNQATRPAYGRTFAALDEMTRDRMNERVAAFAQ